VVNSQVARAADTADVWCDMSPRVLRASPGTTVQVSITCGNHGPDTADNSLLHYTYPAGTTLATIPPGWGLEGTGVGRVFSPANGDTVTCTFAVQVPASATVGSALEQQIQVFPGATDPVSENNSVSGRGAVAAKPVPTPKTPATTSAPPPAVNRPTATKATAAASGTTPPSTEAGQTGAATTASALLVGSTGSTGSTGLPVALSSDDAGSPAAGSDPAGQGSGLAAAWLILIGGMLILGAGVAALLSRRRRARTDREPSV
jgi:hypothetical protein